MNYSSDAVPAVPVQVVLGLGSNTPYQGMTPAVILAHACAALGSVLDGACFSSVYRTKPMYYDMQEDFCNMAVCGSWTGSPRQLLMRTQEIERRFGRNRSREIRNGPRSLDIDIELFGDMRIQAPDLVIPHPRMRERAFVLVPLLEICPEIAEPLTGVCYSAYLQQLPAEEVRYVSDGIQRKG